jgi:PEP-CTERM motif
MISKFFAPLVFAGATCVGAHAGVSYDFTGDYAPTNWTTTLLGTPAGGGAPVGALNGGTTLTMTSGDTGCYGNVVCVITYTVTVLADTTIAFNWSYVSTDIDGAWFDQFGYVVDGLRTWVSPTTSGTSGGTGSGTESVAVLAGQSFGWYFDCIDCVNGNATAIVNNFSATTSVPEPSSLALFGLGLAGLARVRRLRQH